MFLSYLEAQEKVLSVGIKKRIQFLLWNRPSNIPRHPHRTYRYSGWVSWGIFLKTGNVCNREKIFPSYEQAKQIVRQAKIKSSVQYERWTDRPINLPAQPATYYKNKGWTTWSAFLGTPRRWKPASQFASYEYVKEVVVSKGFKTTEEYNNWLDRPSNFPVVPNHFYLNKGWVNWGVFLGTGKFHVKITMSYEEARKIVRDANIRSVKEFKRWNRPHGFAAAPEKVYKKKGWVNWAKFLGTDHVFRKKFPLYEEAKRIVRENNIIDREDYRIMCRHMGLPSRPEEHYKEWKGWPAFWKQ